VWNQEVHVSLQQRVIVIMRTNIVIVKWMKQKYNKTPLGHYLHNGIEHYTMKEDMMCTSFLQIPTTKPMYSEVVFISTVIYLTETFKIVNSVNTDTT